MRDSFGIHEIFSCQAQRKKGTKEERHKGTKEERHKGTKEESQKVIRHSGFFIFALIF